MQNRALWVSATVTFLALCQCAVAQTPDRGTLLISSEALVGTIFEETVVLIVHHDDDGSIGIMVNRPTRLQPADVFPDIAGAGSYTGVLYFGGPLAPNRPYLLARRSGSIEDASIRIIEDVYLSGDPAVLSSMDATARVSSASRIYAGSAQWGPGQLQGEIEAGAWELMRASARMIFSDEPENLWSRAMAAPRGSDTANLAPALRRPADDVILAAD